MLGSKPTASPCAIIGSSERRHPPPACGRGQGWERAQRATSGQAHPLPLPQAGGELKAQFLAAVEVRELGAKVGSLASEGETVLGALDFLLTGV